jgi:hypothetical protein
MRTNMLRIALAVCAAAALALPVSVPVSTQGFTYSISMSGDETVCVGDFTTSTGPGVPATP